MIDYGKENDISGGLMNKLQKKWRSISIGFLFITYMIVIVFLQQPISTWLIIAGSWVLLLLIVFAGTFIGILGILLQAITRRQEPSIPFYRLAYKLGTKNASILASYGLLMLRENKADIAMDCFDRALEHNAYFLTTKTLKCNKAIALWKLGRVDEAIALYLEVIEHFGSEGQKFVTDKTYDQEGIDDLVANNKYMYPQDYTTLGFLYTLQEQYEEALFFSQTALAKKEGFASAYDNIGQIYYFQGDMHAAKENFDKSLELNPKLPDSLYFAALLAKNDGDSEQAKALLLKAQSCKLDGLNTISHEMINEAMATL